MAGLLTSGLRKRRLLCTAVGVGTGAGLLVAVPAQTALAARCRQSVSVGFDGQPVVGGFSATGVVRLRCRLGRHGAYVYLSPWTPTVNLPKRIWIAAGTNSRNFQAATTAVSSPMTQTVTATFGRLRGTTSLHLIPAPTISAFTLASYSVLGGHSTTGTITANEAVGGSGLAVQLQSTDSHVIVPPTVTIPPRGTSVTFPVYTTAVTTPQSAWGGLNALIAGQWKMSTGLTVTPLNPGPAGIVIHRENNAGYDVARPGHPLTGVVDLFGPAPKSGVVVSLSTGNPDLVVPATVTVPYGADNAQFQITALPQDQRVNTTVTATANGASATQGVGLLPAGNIETDYGYRYVQTGQSVTHTLYLTYTQPTDTVVSLTSSDPNVTVPSTVTIPAGKPSVDYVISAASAMTTLDSVQLTFTLGTETYTSPLKAGANGPRRIALPQPFRMGQTVNATGYVVLWAKPSADMTVTLASSDPHVIVPASITVGATGTSFPITTQGTLTNPVTVTITATGNGVTTTQTFVVNP